MIVFIPYVKDATKYADLAAAIKTHGNNANHHLVVVTTPEDEPEAYKFGDSIADNFMDAKTLTLKEGAVRTPIKMANEMFQLACAYTAKFKIGKGEVADPPMMYFDPTYRPVEEGWLAKIQSEYYTKNAPIAFGDFRTDDQMAPVPHGPVMLSKKFQSESGLLSYLNGTVHWRKFLKWEFKDGVNTTLIGQGKDSVLKR